MSLLSFALIVFLASAMVFLLAVSVYLVMDIFGY
jgi:hypothetical protein